MAHCLFDINDVSQFEQITCRCENPVCMRSVVSISNTKISGIVGHKIWHSLDVFVLVYSHKQRRAHCWCMDTAPSKHWARANIWSSRFFKPICLTTKSTGGNVFLFAQCPLIALSRDVSSRLIGPRKFSWIKGSLCLLFRFWLCGCLLTVQ